MASLENLENLVVALQLPVSNNDDEFRNSLNLAQDVLVLDDDRCAELFDVSRPSVNRWRNGVTTPRRIVQRHVRSILLDQTENALKAKKRRVATGDARRVTETVDSR